MAEIVTFALALAGAEVVGEILGEVGAIALALVGGIAVVFTQTGSVPHGFAGYLMGTRGRTLTFIGALPLTLALTLLGCYLGWRSLKGYPRDKWIRQTAIAFGAIGGTSFYGADLTDADFTEATLKSTDFREAILTRTCWRKTKKIGSTELIV